MLNRLCISHGNYVKSHGNVMEKSWKFNFKFEWPPCKMLDFWKDRFNFKMLNPNL